MPIISYHNQHIRVYQKKDAFGPASLEIENFIYNSIEELKIIEAGSILILNNEEYSGDRKNVVEIIYKESL